VSRTRATLRLVAFALFTLPLMPLQQLFIWCWPDVARRFPHHYHRMVARILGVTFSTSGETPARGPLLIASNHVSWLDIVILSAAAPVSFIAKRDVNGWPFFGSLARLQRTVFVNRERRQGTDQSRDDIRARLKSGDILVLFAEGTSNDGHEVRPFKSAFFAAADLPDVKVQPVTLAYHSHWGLPMTRRRRPHYAWFGDMDLAPHLWEAVGSGPIGVEVIFHPPVALAEFGDRKRLAAHAEQTVRAGLYTRLSGKAGMR
jgi:lyso-ornithine lipid O-acyltransferase